MDVKTRATHGAANAHTEHARGHSHDGPVHWRQFVQWLLAQGVITRE